MLLQIDETVAEHSPHISSVELYVVGATEIVDPDLLTGRSFENHDDIELLEILFVLVGESSGIGSQLDQRIQSLSSLD